LTGVADLLKSVVAPLTEVADSLTEVADSWTEVAYPIAGVTGLNERVRDYLSEVDVPVDEAVDDGPGPGIHSMESATLSVTSRDASGV
jgi:hypothetical protein